MYSAIPASALDEEDDEDDDGDAIGEGRDDERTGTRYNVSLYWKLSMHSDPPPPPPVLLVPCYLCNRCHVCCHVADRLVNPTLLLLYPTKKASLFSSTGTWSPNNPSQGLTTLMFTLAGQKWPCGCGLCPVGCACSSTPGVWWPQSSCQIGAFCFAVLWCLLMSGLKVRWSVDFDFDFRDL